MADKKGGDEANVDTGQPAAPIVDWDDSQMESSYANVVNASSTREEVNLFFGTNLTWKASQDKKFHVKLNHRIALSPYAAKRLWILLGAVLKAYEAKYGPLSLDAGAQEGSGTKPGVQ